MYYVLSEKAAWYLVANRIGKKEYLRIYTYGFECLIATMGNIMVVFLAGLLFNMEKELAVYMIFYSILRMQSGGCHQASHVKCIFWYLILAISSIQFVMLIQMTRIGLLFLVMFQIFAVLLVYQYAPIKSANKKVTKEQLLLNKKRSRVTIIVQIIIIGLCYAVNLKFMSISAIAAVSIQSMTLIPLFNKRNEEEKRCSI